jgi:hypothetical protein
LLFILVLLVDLLRRVSSQEEDDQESEMIQRFQMTNAPDSDTEVSFHGRARSLRATRRIHGACFDVPA